MGTRGMYVMSVMSPYYFWVKIRSKFVGLPIKVTRHSLATGGRGRETYQKQSEAGAGITGDMVMSLLVHIGSEITMLPRKLSSALFFYQLIGYRGRGTWVDISSTIGRGLSTLRLLSQSYC